ncbi:MAG: hypothetical protein AAF998_16820 [Bacteroidota bacterium]
MKANLSIILLAFCLVAGTLNSCRAGGAEKMRALQEKADRYLVKDDSIRQFFAITENGIATYASPVDRQEGKAEFRLDWDEIPAFRQMVASATAEEALAHYLAHAEGSRWDAEFAAQFSPKPPFLPTLTAPDRPLKGLRIALDPGHLGGTMDFARKIERKFVRMRPAPRQGISQEIAFNEGNLALATAYILKTQFEAAGATVLLTRTGEGKSSLGLDLDEWLRAERKRANPNAPIGTTSDTEAALLKYAGQNYATDEGLSGKDSLWWCSQASKRDIYRIPFLKQDFRNRAAMINAFQPHLTLIIHYNIHEKNEVDRAGYLKPVPFNYCMAFIPGSFMRGELDEPEERLAFLIKLLTDAPESSQRLCAAVLEQHERQLDVPIMEWDSTLRYLEKASLPTEARGVFARNLSLTRLVHGTICFGESLLQDNLDECQALNQKDFRLPKMDTPLPERVRDVAQAYYDGVINWAKAERAAQNAED